MLPRKFLLLHWMRAAQLLLQLSLVMKRLIVLHPMLIVASAAAEQQSSRWKHGIGGIALLAAEERLT